MLGPFSGCYGKLSIGAAPDDDAGSPYSFDHEVRERGSGSSPVSFEVTARSDRIAPDDPGVLRFAITNTRDESIEVTSGPIPPFGVLFASPTGDGEGFLLWNDAYETSSHVRISDGDVSVADIGIRRRLEPGEREARDYEIRYDADGLSPGSFEVSDVSGLGLRYGDVEYVVDLSISRAEER